MKVAVKKLLTYALVKQHTRLQRSHGRRKLDHTILWLYRDEPNQGILWIYTFKLLHESGKPESST